MKMIIFKNYKNKIKPLIIIEQLIGSKLLNLISGGHYA